MCKELGSFVSSSLVGVGASEVSDVANGPTKDVHLLDVSALDRSIGDVLYSRMGRKATSNRSITIQEFPSTRACPYISKV